MVKYINKSSGGVRLITTEGPLEVAPGATFDVTLGKLVTNADGRTDLQAYEDAGWVERWTPTPPDPDPDPDSDAAEDDADADPVEPGSDDEAEGVPAEDDTPEE